MKRTAIISTIILTILIIAILLILKATKLRGKTIDKTKINDTSVLRTEILNSIKNPFIKTDTLIIETTWNICDEVTGNDLPIIIDTKLEEHPYTEELSEKLGMKVIAMKDFYKIMETVLKYKFHGDYPKSLWDTCRRNKIRATIRTEKSKPRGKILVHEKFLFADTLKSFDKEFYRDENGKWLYKIYETRVDTLNNSR